MARKTRSQKAVRAPGPSKSHENELERLLSAMVRQMGREFEKDAVRPAAGFNDAPQDDYMLRAAQVRKRMEQAYDDKRIETLVRGVLRKTDKRNRKELRDRIGSRMGISTKELTRLTDIEGQVDALVEETQQWVEQLRDETLQMYTNNTLQAIREGSSLEDVMKQFDGLVEKRRNHARFTARNQIQNFSSVTTTIRARNLGITRARWVTSGDERVRGRPGGKYPDAVPDHWWAEGKEFNLNEGLTFPSGAVLQPGMDFNCRCTHELILPEE